MASPFSHPIGKIWRNYAMAAYGKSIGGIYPAVGVVLVFIAVKLVVVLTLTVTLTVFRSAIWGFMGTYAEVGPTSILPLYLYFCQHLILDLVNSTIIIILRIFMFWPWLFVRIRTNSLGDYSSGYGQIAHGCVWAIRPDTDK